MSTISSMSSISSTMNTSAMSQTRGHHKKPDASEMASSLFSALDTKSQGYLEKSDLQSAFDQISSTTSSSSSSSSSSSTSVDELFSQLDADSDGKITKDEMTSGLKKLTEELDSQFASMRQNGFQGMEAGGMGGMGGMPPPPPPENDSGFTKDELSSQLEEIGSTDSQRSDFISNVVNNFEAADTDGDGKVTFQEATAYNDQNSTSSSSSSSTSNSSSTTSTSATSSTNKTEEAKLLHQIMQLMHAYGGAGQNVSQSALSNLVSVSA